MKHVTELCAFQSFHRPLRTKPSRMFRSSHRRPPSQAAEELGSEIAAPLIFSGARKAQPVRAPRIFALADNGCLPGSRIVLECHEDACDPAPMFPFFRLCCKPGLLSSGPHYLTHHLKLPAIVDFLPLISKPDDMFKLGTFGPSRCLGMPRGGTLLRSRYTASAGTSIGLPSSSLTVSHSGDSSGVYGAGVAL